MTSAFKFGRQEGINTFESHFGFNETSREYKHVRIIVRTGKAREFGLPAQSRTYALMFVQRHADAVACAANRNAGINLSGLDSFGAGMCEIRLITALGTECAEILIGYAF